MVTRRGNEMNTINILHIASFNGNIGDNANHNGLRNKLEKILFPKKLNFKEIEMREFYQSWNLRDFNSNAFIELCNEYHLVIIGGGNFFELKWDYSFTGTTINISKETLLKISTPILFFGLGCDIAKGASENAIYKFDEFLSNVTSSDNYLVSVRNDGSYQTLQSLYGTKYNDKIYRIADGAFFMTTDTYDFPELQCNYQSIGINIARDMESIRFNKNITYKEFINGFSTVLDTFLENNKLYQIILIPHIYSDLTAISDLLNYLNDKHRRTRVKVAPYLTGRGSESYIFGLYQQCKCILGMRFHSNVCAIAHNIPTIALSSYKKINDLYRELSLEDRLVNVNERGFEEVLLSKLNNTLKTLTTLSNEYAYKNEQLKKQNDSFYCDLKNWLERKGIL